MVYSDEIGELHSLSTINSGKDQRPKAKRVEIYSLKS